MKRLSVLVVATALAAVAVVSERPAGLDPGPVSTTTTLSAEDEPLARFFHCPWAYADGVTDSAVALVAGVDADYRLSLPVNGEVLDGEEDRLVAGSGVGLPISRVQPVGDSSVIVEFSDGPAAAGVTVGSDGVIAADACPSSLPRIWHVPGGSTRDGQQLTLRLFNPFAEAARIDLAAVSELGAEAASGFEAFTVPARSTRNIDLTSILGGRDHLSLFVEQLEGSVVPALVLDGADGDRATWPGVRQSETWEVPLAADRGLDGVIVLTNSALVPVTYSIDTFDRSATVATPATGEIPGPGQVVVSLDELSDTVFGARISGDGPFGAAVVGTGEGAVAAMPAVPGTSTAWLLPGVNTESTATHRMWVLNTGIDDVSVSYQPVAAVGPVGQVATIEVPAGAVASVDVTGLGTSGLIVEGTGPFSVAWSAIRAPAVAYSAGVAIGG